jgi:hypothetical protein
MKYPVVLAGLAVASGLSSASAAILAGYNFQNTFAPSVTASGVTAGGVVVGAGLSASYAGSAGDRDLRLTGFSTAGTLDPADNDFIAFTLTAATGLALDVDTISILARERANGPETLQLRSNLDGFSTSLGEVTPPSTFGTRSFTLDGAFDAVTSVEFRLYGYDADNVNGRLRLDDLTVNGTVVPEPHEYVAAAGVALLGFAAWRRKAKRA